MKLLLCVIRAQFFWSGPPLVKAATGEVVTSEDLGGGDVHTRLSGVADHLAENDLHALGIARRIVANLNWKKAAQLQLKEIESPLFDAEELYGIIPSDSRKPFDVREIIARIVDGSRFDEFKARFGTTLITGFAHLYGMPVGIIANNGILFPNLPRKAHILLSCVHNAKFHCYSFRILPALWLAASMKMKELPNMVPNWSWQLLQPKFLKSRW